MNEWQPDPRFSKAAQYVAKGALEDDFDKVSFYEDEDGITHVKYPEGPTGEELKKKVDARWVYVVYGEQNGTI